jgi:transposase
MARTSDPIESFVGLVPGVRQSDTKRKGLTSTKAGSPLLRWALVEAAWRWRGRSCACSMR